MLTEVQATSVQGSLLQLPLGDTSNGIALEDVQGLDPVKATIVSSSFPNSTGEQYLAAKREARDVKLKLGLEPDYITEMPADVRARVYQFFMPRTFVGLKFVHSSGLEVDISGMVETCEAPPFTSEPLVDVSVRCFESDFVDLTPNVLNKETANSTFNFEVDYIGSVETGLQFELLVNRDVDQFTMYNTMPDGTPRQLDFAWPMHAGDILRINNVPGEKSIKLVRSGTETSVLYGMSPQSSWIDLYPGTNKLRVYAEGAPIPYTLTYLNRYGGL